MRHAVTHQSGSYKGKGCHGLGGRQPAILHPVTTGKQTGYFHAVGDHYQHGILSGNHIEEQASHGKGRSTVQVTRWFVCQHKAWLQQERTRHGCALAFST
jgi:hypothetical protein